MITTSVSGLDRFTSSSSSIPLAPGILMSVTSTSYGCSASAARASLPSRAIATLWPARSRSSRSVIAMARSSSARRIRKAPSGSWGTADSMVRAARPARSAPRGRRPVSPRAADGRWREALSLGPAMMGRPRVHPACEPPPQPWSSWRRAPPAGRPRAPWRASAPPSPWLRIPSRRPRASSRAPSTSSSRASRGGGGATSGSSRPSGPARRERRSSCSCRPSGAHSRRSPSKRARTPGSPSP